MFFMPQQTATRQHQIIITQRKWSKICIEKAKNSVLKTAKQPNKKGIKPTLIS